MIKINKLNFLIFIFILCGAAFANSIATFKDFPALGSCTGDYVRLRAAPNTDSEILGRLNEFDRVIVINYRIINNKKWFEIENPFDNGRAWVFSDYLIPDEIYEEGHPELLKLFIKLNQDFGVRPEKARAIFGNELRIRTEKSPNPGTPFIKTFITHNNYISEYLNNNLTNLEINGNKMQFGDFKIGDKAEKLIKILGEPTERAASLMRYQLGETAYFEFSVKDGVITHMRYKVYYEI